MSSKNEKPDVFCKNSVLRNFAKFTGKHLRQGLRSGLKLYQNRDYVTGAFL